MLKNYLIIAVRHLRRHKLFSAINILCLAIGITFSMVIGVYIINQKKVNASIKNVDNQYFIKSKWKVKNMGLPITTVAPLAKTLKEKYPDIIANYYRFNPVTNVVSAGDKHFKENIAICDTTFVSMFGFELLHGDNEHAFKNNASAVITEAMAIKLFGNTNAIDKTITITNTTSDKQDFAVSAVLKTIPYCTVNNAIDPAGYNVFVPLEGNRYFQGGTGEDSWNNIYMPGMIELKTRASVNALFKATEQTLTDNLPGNLKGLLQPEFVSLKEYYLKDNNGAVQKMITVLSLIAAFILLMAIINFININIGTSSYRIKEIGLRKVFGGARGQLVVQHLTEALVITFFAALLSLFFYEMVRPIFDQVLSTRLDRIWKFDMIKTGLLFSLVIAIGLTSGIYPAFILSASSLIRSVKGKVAVTTGGVFLRQGLLVVQFSLAIFIFIAALNVSKQVSYFFQKDLGYNRDQLLVLTAFPKQWDSTGVQKMEMIKNGLKELAVVQSASLSYEVPDRTPPTTIDLLPEGATKPLVIPFITVDEEYASTFAIQKKEGTFFNNYLRPAVNSEIVLNETAAKMLGTSVGETIRMPSGFSSTVTGIVKDFNYSSFQQSIGPLAFIHVNSITQYRFLTLKLHSADISSSLSQIKEKWKTLSPSSPFEYTFMDQRFQSLYSSELQLKKATNVATILNLLIVLMGIFGVVAFTLARRNKEIAVRKVLGAEVKNILFLFIKDYAWLILIANLIAWPVAYFVINNWLQNYSYRIEQNIFSYLTVCLLVFFIAFLAIAAQCFKTAIAKPIKSLRTE
jgi:putative ABC transport system permease protein